MATCAVAENEQVATIRGELSGGAYAASFFLREARALREMSPSLSMK